MFLIGGGDGDGGCGDDCFGAELPVVVVFQTSSQYSQYPAFTRYFRHVSHYFLQLDFLKKTLTTYCVLL